MTNIGWSLKDWDYYIVDCSPFNTPFPETPPIGVNRTWEITVTPEYVKIKCNALQVLHFIFSSTYNSHCISKVKGKIATTVKFTSNDTATKIFNLDLVGR